MSFKVTNPRMLAYLAGSLATQVVIASLGAYMPSLLEHLAGASPWAIGCLMAILPLFGLFVQPFVNALSDRVRSPWGRRRPFLALGAPLGAVGLLGLSHATSLASAAFLLGLLGIGFTLVDGPYRASTSELWSTQEQTVVSAGQSLIKGIGTMLAFALVALFTDRAFQAAGAVWLVSVLTAMAAMGGTCEPAIPRANPKPSDSGALRPVIPLVLALFCVWFGLQAVTTFVVSFIVHDLAGIADVASAAGRAAAQQAMLQLGVFAVVTMLVSLPVGALADRHGRRATLRMGLLVLALGYGVAILARHPAQTYAFAMFGGVGFAALQVVAYPLMLERVQPGREGRLSSLYNATIDAAQLGTMLACGWLIAWAHGYRVIFELALGSTLLGWALLARRSVEAARVFPVSSLPTRPSTRLET